MQRRALLSALAVLAGGIGAAQEPLVLDGVTFASDPDVLYVPIKSIGFRAGWTMTSDETGFYVDGRKVQIPRVLPDGTKLIRADNLVHLGLTPVATEDGFSLSVGYEQVLLRPGGKRVVVNKAVQRLRAYQGSLVVLDTRVSTGRKGYTTPNGTWKAGPQKVRMRYSRKYENSPMPWSVQVVGGYFIHGYYSVPRRPASHGCIRLPLRGANPAREFWHWIDLGTPITIANDWVEVD